MHIVALRGRAVPPDTVGIAPSAQIGVFLSLAFLGAIARLAPSSACQAFGPDSEGVLIISALGHKQDFDRFPVLDQVKRRDPVGQGETMTDQGLQVHPAVVH